MEPGALEEGSSGPGRSVRQPSPGAKTLIAAGYIGLHGYGRLALIQPGSRAYGVTKVVFKMIWDDYIGWKLFWMIPTMLAVWALVLLVTIGAVTVVTHWRESDTTKTLPQV